jgi:AraC-like DNA-binding protein
MITEKKGLLILILYIIYSTTLIHYGAQSEEKKKRPIKIIEKNGAELEKLNIQSPVKLMKILEENRYSGKSINFVFKNADIRKIIEDISKITGFEIEIAQEVQGKVTYNWKQIPWNRALSQFLEDNNLEIFYDGKLLKIQKKRAPSLTVTILISLLLLILMAGSCGLVYYKKKSIKATRNKYTDINPDKAEEFAKRIVYLLEVEKIYQEENLSLHSLAERLSIPYYILSKIINEKLERTFSDLINYHRIEEAKKRLKNRKQSEIKIINIAFDVGFGTKTAFNRTFKKYTGMTPSQYRKKVNP